AVERRLRSRPAAGTQPGSTAEGPDTLPGREGADCSTLFGTETTRGLPGRGPDSGVVALGGAGGSLADADESGTLSPAEPTGALRIPPTGKLPEGIRRRIAPPILLSPSPKTMTAKSQRTSRWSPNRRQGRDLSSPAIPVPLGRAVRWGWSPGFSRSSSR